jgi:aryl-alcohol dehydrogenase-like predicted oxidoreductase
MLTRRAYLKNAALVSAACTLPASLLQAFESSELITRAIPKSGEKLPVVGLGSSATFRQVAQSEDIGALKRVLETLMENGGTVFDTAPGYGASEEVAGKIVQDSGLTDTVFWASKVNVASRGGGKADPERVHAQLEDSFGYAGKDPIDLIQVHNLGDPATQIPIIQEMKEEGRLRYIGITSTRASNYPVLEQVMRDYPLDFIGVDYAVDNQGAADRILPLAQQLGIATLIYVPFGRSRLF